MATKSEFFTATIYQKRPKIIFEIASNRLSRIMEGRAEKRLRQDTELWNTLSVYMEASRFSGCSFSDYDILYH